MNTRASSCDSLDSRDDVVEVKYKVTMLGDTSVGKTSMLVSLEGGDYDAHPRPTVGKTKLMQGRVCHLCDCVVGAGLTAGTKS